MHHFQQGLTTKQAHKAIPEGHFEEEQGRQGFFGPVSHLIRENPSTNWVEIEGSLRPRLYDLVELPHDTEMKRLLYNDTVAISNFWVQPVAPDRLSGIRNSDGDLLYFCHRGSGSFWTEYGLLNYRPGQYVCIRKAMVHTIVANETSQFLVVEATESYFREPDRGMVGRHAVYDINAIGKPDLDALHAAMKKVSAKVTDVRIKRGTEFTKYKFASNIYDVVGWKGDLFPFTLHVDDMMPLLSHRAHLPPSAHTTLVANDFVVCTFLPRPLESDADALKVPFYHQNMDYDEVLFYHDGDFFSRDNLHAGMMSFHPAGFPHGPHPKAMEKVKTKTHTDEYAVMIDTRRPLKIDSFLEPVEVKNYWQSWMKK